MNSIAYGGVIESDSEGKSALATLPAEWVKPVGFFALTKLYLLKSRGPLCANLKYWISKGLTIDDAKRIFQRLCDPEVAQNHNFENQLMTELAAMVSQVLRRRRILREQQLRREADKETEFGVSREDMKAEVAKTILSFADSIGLPQERKEKRA